MHIDFIGIGFRRCGSSWLHSVLNQHPMINKPDKGLHFFSGKDSCIEKKEEYDFFFNKPSRNQIVGEFSVSYSYPDSYKKSAQSIHNYYPDVKIICVIRNPIERAFSDYTRSLKFMEIPKGISFRKAIKEYPELINRGFYGEILGYYASIFKESLHIFYYEDLVEDPYKFVTSLYKTLEVKGNFCPMNLLQGSVKKWQPRSKVIQKLLNSLERWMLHNIGDKNKETFKAYAKQIGIISFIKKITRKKTTDISHRDYNYVYNIYCEDMHKVSELTGRELSIWHLKYKT